MEATPTPTPAAGVSAGEQKSKPAAVSKPDKHLWGIILLLCLVSVIELYSASSREVTSSSMGIIGPIVRHSMMLLGGMGLVWYLSRRHYSDFALFSIVFSIISVALMVYVMFFGNVVNDARRSLTILGVGIFPAEMLKLSAVLMVVLIMTLNQNPKAVGITGKGMVYCGLVLLVCCGLLATQGLTNTLLLIAITGSMMIVGGVQVKHLLYLALASAAIAVVFIGVLFMVDPPVEYIKKNWPDSDMAKNIIANASDDAGNKHVSRLDTWISRLSRHSQDSIPKWELSATGINRQEVLSYMAQAHGGVTGVGPGNSREAARLPLAFSDYIFAIVIEEIGLIGGIFVIMLYLWLLGRAASIGSRCSYTYPALLVMGMAIMIVLQALAHMGIVSGFFPVSGQPLPMISKGGTSIIVTSIALGIMLSVSRTATGKSNKKQEMREEGDTLPEQLRDENRMQL